MQTFFLWTIKPLAYKVGLAKRAPLYTLIASPQRNQKKQLGYLKSLREAPPALQSGKDGSEYPPHFSCGDSSVQPDPEGSAIMHQPGGGTPQ
jgi:hypothetical protein